MKKGNRFHKISGLFCIAAILMTGCGRELSNGSTERQMTANDATESETGRRKTGWQETVPTSEVTELEKGLSVVRFDGDDGFAAFLQSGGADSDSGVVSYLMENLLSGETDLRFSGLPFGCSTVSVEGEDGERLFGRNFDWYNCNALIVESHPEQGYASLSTVNTDFISQSVGTLGSFFLKDEVLTLASLYAPLDGMNETGLCVSVNMIEDSDTIDQDTGKPGLTTTTAVRMLLNEAATVDEAVALLESYDLHASFGYMVHLALADAEGKSAVVEYVNNEMVVTDTPIVTNFYIAQGEKNGIGTRQSHTRFEILQDTLRDHGPFSMEGVRDALESVSKHHFQDGETTEWSAVFNQTTGEALYYHREDYSTPYYIVLDD